MLRYFVYGEKWKKRIIKDFNNIYANAYGDILKKAIKDMDRCFHRGCFFPFFSYSNTI